MHVCFHKLPRALNFSMIFNGVILTLSLVIVNALKSNVRSSNAIC